jgi:hypothetical protein
MLDQFMSTQKHKTESELTDRSLVFLHTGMFRLLQRSTAVISGFTRAWKFVLRMR